MDIRKQTISGVKWTTLSTLVITLSNLLKISILARYLDKSDFGLMALIMFVLGFMNLFIETGIPTAILHKQEVTRKEYASLYWFNIGISLIIFLLIYFSSPLIAGFYEEPELVKLIPIMSSIIIISSIGQQFKTVLQKHLNFQLISKVELIASTISMILAWYLAINNYGIYSLVFSTLLQYALSNFVFLIIGIKEGNVYFHYRYSETKPFIKIGAYQVGGQITNYFNRDLDILIIGKFFGTDVLGGYSLAKQLVLRPAQVVNPILIRVASPVLAKFQSNIAVLRESYLKLVNIVASINIPVYLGIVLFAPLIVKILYGESYINIVMLVRILSIQMVFRSFSNPMGSLVVATGRTDLALFWNLIKLPISPIAIFIGSFYSIELVAVSIATSAVFLFIPSWWLMIRKMINATLAEYAMSIVPFYRVSLRNIISLNRPRP